MAQNKKLYYGDIDKNTEWTGDESTEYKPVAGESIQKYIKETFEGKAGCFYYDDTNNRYLVFADTDTKDAYLENPDNVGLIIGTFDAPFNYSAEIDLISNDHNAILIGTTGNTIEFTFDTKNKNGQSVGEDVICTYQIIKGSSKKTITQRYKYGQRVSFVVDEYLESGTNRIIIGISGQNTLAATTLSVTYQVVDLQLEDEFDIAKFYSIDENIILNIPYTVSGYGTKVMEWHIFGANKLDFNQAEDEINEISASRVKTIELGKLNQGTYNIQFRVYTIIDGEKFYSKTLYREFMVVIDRNDRPKTWMATSTELEPGTILDGYYNINYPIKAEQYIPHPIKFAAYTYGVAETPINILVGGKLAQTINAKNGVVYTYDFIPITTNTVNLAFEVGERIINEYRVTTKPSDISIREIDDGLELNLRALGKSNNATDRDRWKYGNHTATLEGFDWTETSGWNNGELIIPDGARVNFDLAPFATDPSINGKTLEFEFSTSRVLYDNAPMFSINSDTSLAGLNIKTSRVILTSAGGVELTDRFKSGENIRISVVINRKTGTTNKGIAMIYINGMPSRAINFASTDNFTANGKMFFSGTEESTVHLKQVMVYNRALSSDEILNNYILYRPNVSEMLKIYNRNNVYEEGTTNLSPELLQSQSPVMIITGDIPTLEATTDKKLAIKADIEYVNLQDRSKSFKWKNAQVTPQGTSSMGFPKKNFRIYTQKRTDTVCYDADGKVVKDKLYSFTDNAIPVNCWCLKADYAESSGAHNTGVARIWNDVMKDAQIDGEYKLRTQAQQAAINEDYPYDVRTTIDGFPIVLFYRLTEDSPLVFIGKYNFNNDKSTENVFGFRDIPGFDNSKVECWETLNNGNDLALFKDTSRFDLDWDKSFESRYPDGSTNTEALKELAEWLSSTKDNLSKFSNEKWEHLDVYKVAAYYIYLMRFGAVDQPVKNSMLTTEDGVHWFFINYDNDTIAGLRNDGPLVYNPDIDRQTLDTSFNAEVYAYAGHDSVLWNNFEADEECMSIVQEVDDALYSAGLSYENLMKTFDENQTDKWCERVYTQDAQYKYISPYVNSGINNLYMLQGSRKSHRRWWFAKRFALIDSKFTSGAYKASTVEIKCAGAPAGLTFDITAGEQMNYGYGVNNVIAESGVALRQGESHTFTTNQVLNVGDPLRLYASPNIEAIDLTNFAPYLSTLSVDACYSESQGTKLKKLIVNNGAEVNGSLTEISGLNQCKYLEELNVSNCMGLTSLDLTELKYLKKFSNNRHGATSVLFAPGALLEEVNYSDNMQSINLVDLPLLRNIGIRNLRELHTVEVRNCPNFNLDDIINRFVYETELLLRDCKLIVEGINSTQITYDTLLRIGLKVGELSLKGTINLPDEITPEQAYELKQVFGNNCFSKDAELYIKVPTNAMLIGPDTVEPFTTNEFEVVSFGEEIHEVVWTGMSNNTSKDKINYLTTEYFSERDKQIITATVLTKDGQIIQLSKKVTFVPWNEPDIIEIDGPTEIREDGTYYFNTVLKRSDGLPVTGYYKAVPDIVIPNDIYSKLSINSFDYFGEEYYGQNAPYGGFGMILKTINEGELIDTEFTVKCKVTLQYPNHSTTILSEQTLPSVKVLLNVVGDVICTSSSNPELMKLAFNNGWSKSANYLTKQEAARVVGGIGDLPRTLTKFNEFQYFINYQIRTLSSSSFQYVEEISMPWETINNYWPFYFQNLVKINFPNLKEIELTTTSDNIRFSFLSNSKVRVINFPKLERITAIHSNNPFIEASALEYLTIPNLNYVKMNETARFISYANTLSTLEFNTNSLYFTCGFLIANCDKLVSLNFPNLIELSGSGTLLGYSNGMTMKFPELRSVDGNIQLINNCNTKSLEFPRLKSIETNSNLKSIFINGTRIISVDFPNLQEVSGYTIISNCNNLEELEFPKLLNITSLSYSDFISSNKNLLSVKFPELRKLLNLEAPLISSCIALKTIELPKLEEVQVNTSNGLLYYCNSLEELIFPKLSAFRTSYNGFYHCNLLKILSFPSISEISVQRLFYEVSESTLETLKIGTTCTELICKLPDSTEHIELIGDMPSEPHTLVCNVVLDSKENITSLFFNKAWAMADEEYMEYNAPLAYGNFFVKVEKDIFGPNIRSMRISDPGVNLNYNNKGGLSNLEKLYIQGNPPDSCSFISKNFMDCRQLTEVDMSTVTNSTTIEVPMTAFENAGADVEGTKTLYLGARDSDIFSNVIAKFESLGWTISYV